jgi:predicted alpha/beta-hydrolase family hydrolase
MPPAVREKLRIDAKSSVTIAATGPADFRPGATPALVLAPGAGSDLDTPLLLAIERELAPEFLVVRFNFPYREEGRGVPDAQKRLEATYGAVLAWLAAHGDLRPGPIVAGGKSMGGRIATHLAAAGADLEGLVLLGYPLHPPGQPGRLRAAHLARIRCPLLFVQGSRDALCRLDLLAPVCAALPALHRLLVIDQGDHSFKVPKRTGRTAEEVTADVTNAVGRFVRDVASGTLA